MQKVDSRESAHVKSRVKDLSVVPNVVDFTGLFTAITPISKLTPNAEGVYEPVLIRDVDSLIATFGDPRIDPEKYIDLYSIMQVVGNGTSCYVNKVNSGKTGEYEVAFVEEDHIIDKDNLDADIQDITGGIDVTPYTSTFTVDGLHNKYLISGLIAHDDEHVSQQAVPASYSVGDMTFTAVTPGTAGNSIYVQVVANADNSSNFDLKVGLSEDSLDTVLSNVSDFDTLNSDLITVIIDGTPSVMAEPSALTGGTDEVVSSPAKEWELQTSDYSVEFVEDTSFEPSTWTLNITVLGGDTPEKIIVKEAILDPEYGREDLELELHHSTGQDDPYNGLNVYQSTGLDRMYTIMSVTGTDGEDENAVIASDSYVAEWSSSSGKYNLYLILPDTVSDPVITKAARRTKSIKAFSSMSDDVDIVSSLVQAKPYSLKVFYLVITVSSNGNTLGTAKVKLESTTSNQGLVNSLNSALGTFVRFELADPDTAEACEVREGGKDSIVKSLLDKWAPYDGAKRKDLDNKETPLPDACTTSRPNFKVTMQDYVDAVNVYRDKKYSGQLMADFVAPVTHSSDDVELTNGLQPLNSEERRSLHYYLKQVACERKSCNVILSTPYIENYNSTTVMQFDDICDWVAAQNKFSDLWEYGQTNTTDYSLQSFYLEMYTDWLNMKCTKIENGLAKSVDVKVAPSNLVVNNILTSWRERGVQYPVAGDQGGVLPDTCTVLMNPATKAQRDQLVQYRINPIWDTGTRGVQIYGNETLNAGYTDLNAAHIARTLVYIRSTIDEYTEQLKFSINSPVLWDIWKNYVSQRILDPLVSANALSEYSIAMGTDTTSPEEIANRTIRGKIALIFFQSAEIFDLEYTVYSSSTTLEEAMG